MTARTPSQTKPAQVSTPQRKFLIKLLAVFLLALLICYLPQEILFWKLCTEQDRDLPPNTEVLVSACKKPVATGVPGGEVLFVHEVRTDKMYLLDLRTGDKIKLLNDSLLLEKGVFLSSDLVWLEGSRSRPGSPGYRPDYVLDLNDGKRYELLDLTWLPLKDGKFDPEYYEYFKSAEQVFIHHRKNKLIALSSNPSQGNGLKVIFSQSSLGTHSEGHESGVLLEQLMKDLHVNYEIIDFSLYDTNIPSPTNKYVARFDGLFFAQIDPPKLIEEGMFNYFRGWYYDESAIVVQRSPGYLINDTILGTHFVIYNPILKLRLPIP